MNGRTRDVPENPRHPGPIYGSARPDCASLNTALLFQESPALRVGEELALRCRVLIPGRHWSRAELDAAFRAFAAEK
ncbi:MAG: hypothetical protein AVDCRST_MAG88-2476 [uncultured Thermomicrobiales bacterium]|uniref:Uncharacterized protein n=1 Tax=uncultured Thermomicrobiales bacterium TaxID=1645740 RepID=A0A6J4V9C0_9BACT|nr:MAG: hypothetical protein AVDCRST_MAG88-2476 [uncultured Thermomicrobiales bacterium]